MDDLTSLANRFGSDKGNVHAQRHNYSRAYSELFAPLRDKKIRFVELGLFHPENPNGEISSLEIWRRYFTEAEIVGMDIRPGEIQGDSGRREDLVQLGTGFDIVIDDASHASEHQQTAFGFLAKRMNPGGIYCIEDLHWQPEWSRGTTARDMLYAFKRTGRIESQHMMSSEIETLNHRIDSVSFVNSSWGFQRKDALAVIRFR